MILLQTAEQIATIAKEDDTKIIIGQYGYLWVVLMLVSGLRLHWELKRPFQHSIDPYQWPLLRWYEVQAWAWALWAFVEAFYGYRNYHFTFDHDMVYTGNDSALNLWGTTVRSFCITWIALPFLKHYRKLWTKTRRTS